jgi:hypothetical protein
MARLVRPVGFFTAILAVLAAGVALSARAPGTAQAPDTVQLAPGAAVQLATPPFLAQGKRYAFTWPGGGPAQTYLVKTIRPDGWVLVDAADETLRPDQYVPGEFPQRWLHVGMAISIQEMRDLP